MDKDEIQKEIVAEEVVGTPADVVSPVAQAPREFRKNSRKAPPRREARVKPEFDQKIIDIRRVTRVVTGGRRFSFSVAVVIGDRKGRVGVGQGKAGDTPVAIDKAVRDARKNMIKVNMTKYGSIPHEVEAKYSSSRVLIMRAPGKGVLAGSSVRTVLEFAGLKEVSSKIWSRSKNKTNNAKAAIKALSQIKAKK
ncbi:MAG: 30S ribosomal protein S5 [Nitrospira sp.]